MIHDVDESLRELVRRDVLNGAKVEVAFDAPTREWSARQNSPALNLYLYDIREDLDRREAQFEEVRDDNGFVVDRRFPPRRFKLSYMVTAWTQRAEDEHRLLSSVISCFVRFDALPPEVLQGTVADQPYPVRLTVGLPLPAERSISDVWTALGGELKPSLDLIVTVPFDSGRHRTFGPPVLEEPRIGLFGPDGRRRSGGVVEGVKAGKGGRRRSRPAAGTDGPDTGGSTRSFTEGPPALAVETVEPPEGQGGRRLTVRTIPRP